MRQFAIKVQATKPVAIPDPLVMLDRGLNVFNVVTDDLESLLEVLQNEGVTILKTMMMEQDPSGLEDISIDENPSTLMDFL